MNLADLAAQYGDFYVPAFAVRVDGADLVRNLAVAVTQAEADLTLGGMGRFSFTVVNAFDLDRREFVDGYGDELLTRLAFGARVEIAMGYGDVTRLPVLISGVITEIGTNFSDGGAPELNVSGYDNAYPMSVGKNSESWSDIRDSDVVAQIARDYNLRADIVPTATRNPQVEQNQESDLEFIGKLAARNARYKTYITGTTLRFGPARSDEAAVATLPYGAGLLSFKPEANLAGQVGAVEVLGWDPLRKDSFIGRARRGEEPGRDPRRQSAADQLGRMLRQSPTLRIRHPVKSQAEADTRARAALAERAEQFLTGEGESLGVPDLRPDRNVELAAIGSRFSKTYYLEQTTHRADAGGYRTRFKVKETTL